MSTPRVKASVAVVILILCACCSDEPREPDGGHHSDVGHSPPGDVGAPRSEGGKYSPEYWYCRSTCQGCCEVSGRCQPGTSPSACGTGGANCRTCSPGQICRIGSYGYCAGCSSHDQCGQEEHCNRSRCASVFGRKWQIKVVSTKLNSVTPQGKSWDPFSGAPGLPDPYLTICVNKACSKSSTFNNMLNISWDFSVEHVLARQDHLIISVYDADDAGPELIGTIGAKKIISVDDLRKQDLVFKPKDPTHGIQEMKWALRPK